MTMRVRDLLDKFRDFEVLAGSGGLNKKVSTVSVMDAPDIYNWMKGGEFLITTAYVMKEDPMELKELITRLNRAEAAALGIKLGRFINELPQAVREIADELNFPIIYIPTKYAFADVINPVLTNIVNDQAKKLEMSEKIHKSFTELVIEGKETQDIIDTLRGILNKDVAFNDLFFNKIYINSNCIEFSEDVENLSISSLQNKYFIYDVKISSNFYGYIIINQSHKTASFDELEKITIEHASTVLKLDIQRKISNFQIKQKYRSEFIQDLITNNIRTVEEVKNRANMYGWEIDSGLLCIIVDIDNFKEKYITLNSKKPDVTKELQIERNKIFNISRIIMKENFYKCFYTEFSDSIVFLVEPDILPLESFLKKVRTISDSIREKVVENTRFTATVGIGSYEESIMDVYISFLEAQRTVKIGRTIYDENKTVFYSELGVYKLLYNLTLNEDMNDFCNEYLRPLIDYDMENNTDYVNSLHKLIKNDWNLKMTADEMYIHYNTMKYRFNKICEILNLSLDNSEQKFAIELVYKLMNMSNQYSLYMKTNI